MKPNQKSAWKTIPTKHIEEKGTDVIVDGTDSWWRSAVFIG